MFGGGVRGGQHPGQPVRLSFGQPGLLPGPGGPLLRPHPLHVAPGPAGLSRSGGGSNWSHFAHHGDMISQMGILEPFWVPEGLFAVRRLGQSVKPSTKTLSF